MPRPTSPAVNALGAAMRAHRAARVGDEVAAELGLERGTYYRLERGTHRPSADTALKLARWLGWSMEQVMEAAKAPAPNVESPLLRR